MQRRIALTFLLRSLPRSFALDDINATLERLRIFVGPQRLTKPDCRFQFVNWQQSREMRFILVPGCGIFISLKRQRKDRAERLKRPCSALDSGISS
jgi:hypothetical protein